MSRRREYDDYFAEERPRRKRYIRCNDRMCGAEDCPNCHPENFRGGVWIEDLKDEDGE